MHPPLADAMLEASCNVLETMFFSEGTPASEDESAHSDPMACAVHFHGAEQGTFHVVLDGASLDALCSGFYGEDDISPEQREELLAELTNMLAGSTLSRFAPERSCTLSSPELCEVDPDSTFIASPGHVTRLNLTVEDGLLSIACLLAPPHGVLPGDAATEHSVPA